MSEKKPTPLSEDGGPVDRVDVPVVAPMETPVVGVPAAAPVGVNAEIQPPAGNQPAQRVEVLAAAPVELPLVAPVQHSVDKTKEESLAFCKAITDSWKEAWDEFMNKGAPPLIYRGPIDRVEVPAAVPVGIGAEIQPPARNQPVDENRHNEVQVVEPAESVEIPAAVPEEINAEIQPPVRNQLDGEAPRLPMVVAGDNVLPVSREINNTVIRGSEQILSNSDSFLREFLARLPSTESLKETGRKLDESIVELQNVQQMVKNLCGALQKTKQCMGSVENTHRAGGVYESVDTDLPVYGSQLSKSKSLTSKVEAGIVQPPHVDMPPRIQPPPLPINDERRASADAYARDHELIRTGFDVDRYQTNFERLLIENYNGNLVPDVDNNVEMRRRYFNGLRERFSGFIDEYLLEGASLLASHRNPVFDFDVAFLKFMERGGAAEYGFSSERLIKDYLESVFPRE